MPTNAQLKTLTKAQIQDQTAPESVTRLNIKGRIDAAYDYTDQQVLASTPTLQEVTDKGTVTNKDITLSNVVSKSIEPATNTTYSLGTTSKRWSLIWSARQVINASADDGTSALQVDGNAVFNKNNHKLIIKEATGIAAAAIATDEFSFQSITGTTVYWNQSQPIKISSNTATLTDAGITINGGQPLPSGNLANFRGINSENSNLCSFSIWLRTDKEGVYNSKLKIGGTEDIVASNLAFSVEGGHSKIATTIYPDDAAADADTNLPSGSLYKVTGNRGVFQKP